MSQTPHIPPLPASQPGSDQGGAPPTASYAPDGPPRRRTLPIVIVTAIIAGGLGALAALVLGPSSNTDDAAIVCAKVETFDLPIDREELRPGDPLLHQLLGISSFAAAATLGDSGHAALEEPAQDLTRGLQTFNDELLNDSLEQISTACKSIDY